MSILSIIEKIRSISGTKAKQEYFNEVKDELKITIKYTYNLLLGVVNITFTEVGEEEITDSFLNNCLYKVSNDCPVPVRGNEAINHIISCGNKLNKENQTLLKNILDGNLRMGIGVVAINKAYGEEFVFDPNKHYMRCSLPTDKILDKFDWNNAVVQEKFDGAYFEFNSMDWGLRTRSGTLVPFECNPFEEYMGCFDGILMGELVLYRDGIPLTREISNGLINSMLKGTPIPEEYKAIYHVWDWKETDSDVCDISYEDRHEIAGHIASHYRNIELVESQVVKNYEEAMKVAKGFIEDGKEGAVLKTTTMKWKAGTSKEQIKLKVECDVDLEIVELVKANDNGKFSSTFGSMKCQTSDGLLEVNVSGFSDAQRKYIYENQDLFIGKIISVTFNNILTPENHSIENKASLFLPRVTKDSNGDLLIRMDKTEADSYDRVVEIFETGLK